MSTGTNDPAVCPYCGNFHKAMCPRIKRVEYSDMNPGMFKVVEFFAPNDYAPKLPSYAPPKHNEYDW